MVTVNVERRAWPCRHHSRSRGNISINDESLFRGVWHFCFIIEIAAAIPSTSDTSIWMLLTAASPSERVWRRWPNLSGKALNDTHWRPQFTQWCAGLVLDTWAEKCTVKAKCDVAAHTQDTQKSFCCIFLHVCTSKRMGCLQFAGLFASLIPKVWHEICIHIW